MADRAVLKERIDERNKKKESALQLASLLGKELDQLIQAEKERADALAGNKVEQKFSLYQTLFPYKSEDPDDLNFEANEILRWVESLWLCV